MKLKRSATAKDFYNLKFGDQKVDIRHKCDSGSGGQMLSFYSTNSYACSGCYMNFMQEWIDVDDRAWMDAYFEVVYDEKDMIVKMCYDEKNGHYYTRPATDDEMANYYSKDPRKDKKLKDFW